MADIFASAPSSFGGSTPVRTGREHEPLDTTQPIKKERKRKEPPTGDAEQPAKKRKTAEPGATPRRGRPRKQPGPTTPRGSTPTDTPRSPAVDDAEELSEEEVDPDVFRTQEEVQRRAAEGEDDEEESDEGEDEDEDEKTRVGDEVLGMDETEMRPQEKAMQMRELISQFNNDQMARYEAYRRSHFPLAQVKKIITNYTGCTAPPPTAIVMAGISKLFVGELVELGRTIQEEWARAGVDPVPPGQPLGPLKPSHIREAYRRLKAEGKLPYSKPQRLFKR